MLLRFAAMFTRLEIASTEMNRPFLNRARCSAGARHRSPGFYQPLGYLRSGLFTHRDPL